MCMNSDKPHKCIESEDLLNMTKLNVDKFGLQVIMVSSTSYSPAFAYSIGLWETYSHPEIICFGLPDNLGHEIINDIAEIIKGGEELKIGKIYYEIFEQSKTTFLKVDQENVGDYFGAALNYYGNNNLDALELIWTDRNDRFPWEEYFEEEFVFQQPLLDRNADFKFPEPKNLTSFTTRQWVEEQKPILRVIHDYDGDWQFLTGDQMPEDIKIVALEELIVKDNTLNALFNLEYGEAAEREFIGGHWSRSKLQVEL